MSSHRRMIGRGSTHAVVTLVKHVRIGIGTAKADGPGSSWNMMLACSPVTAMRRKRPTASTTPKSKAAGMYQYELAMMRSDVIRTQANDASCSQCGGDASRQLCAYNHELRRKILGLAPRVGCQVAPAPVRQKLRDLRGPRWLDHGLHRDRAIERERDGFERNRRYPANFSRM